MSDKCLETTGLRSSCMLERAAYSLGGDHSSPKTRPMAKGRACRVLCPKHNLHFISITMFSYKWHLLVYVSLPNE